MSKKKILGLLFLTLLIVGVSMFHGLRVMADRGHLRACSVGGDPNDTDYFPYRFICGSDNKRITPRVTKISADVPGSNNPNSPQDITAGQRINFSGGINTSGTNGTGVPKYKDGNSYPTSDEMLIWATIDGNNALLGSTLTTAQAGTGTISVTNSNGTDAGKVAQCPGDNSGPWNGSSYTRGMYSVVYNHRDLAHGSNGSFGPNQSPAAWDGTDGKEDCGHEGKMVYWRHASQGTNYSFSLDLPAGVEGDVCIRYNVSLRFETGVAENDPLFLGDNATNNDGNNDQNSVASHVVQQSERECYHTNNLPPPQSTGTCDTYDRLPLQAASDGYRTYKFSYYSYDTPHVTGPPANTSVASSSDISWQSYDVAPEAFETMGSGASASTAHIRYTYSGSPGNFSWTYGAPHGPDRKLYIEWWEQVSNAPNPGTHWEYHGLGEAYPGGYHKEDNCYSASCEIKVDPAIAADPDNIVAGQDIPITVTIQNTGQNPLIIFGDGYGINFDGNFPGAPNPLLTAPYKLNATWTNKPPYKYTESLTLKAPSTAGNYTLTGYPVYFNNFALQGQRNGVPFGLRCTSNLATISTKQPFVLTPHAILTHPSGTDENPGDIDYQAYIDNSPNPGATVNAAQTSTFQKNNGDVVPANTTTGPFSPGNPLSNYTLDGIVSGALNTVKAGDKYCTKIALNEFNTGALKADGTIVDKQLINDPAQSLYTSDEKCFTVHNKPYFEVYGSGISAGGNFDNAGCVSANGTLAGWAKNTLATPVGSGAEYFALANKNITGFLSAEYKGIATPTGAVRGGSLTYANSGLAGLNTHNESPFIGGQFAGTHCIKTYTPPSTATNIPTDTVDLSTLPRGIYKHTGKLEISASATINTNIEVYATDDIFVAGDIRTTATGMIGNFASLKVHSKGGSIYVNSPVTSMYGVYTAEGGNSKIFTCSQRVGPNNFQPVILSTSYFDTCNAQLTVWGALSAKQINLMRTYGSLRNNTGPVGNCSVSTSVNPTGQNGMHTTCASELIRFAPSLYLAPSADNVDMKWGKYDQITSLPPVL
jgi:hypothetical protein